MHRMAGRGSNLSLVGKMSFAQIKFPLDAASRLVLQFTAPIEIVNSLPLGGDQQALYFVMKLAMLSAGAIASISAVYMF